MQHNFLRGAGAVALSAALSLLLSCAAGSGEGGAPRAGGGAGTGGEAGGAQGGAGQAGASAGSGGGAGSGVVLGGSGGGGAGGAPWIGQDLPDPWQYYDEDTERAFKDDALPNDVRDRFAGGPTSDGAPAIVYPLDGAMHPLNLGDITFQWSQGDATNSLYRIDATASDGRTSSFYVTCTPHEAGQCSYQLPESDWLWLAADYAGGEVTIAISATNPAGGPVRTSTPIVAHFSPEPVYGALYYWAAGAQSLKRATFGAKKAVPYIEPESETNQFRCVACHSVSRNGEVIAFAVSNLHGETVAAIQTAPTEDPASPYVEPAKGTTPFGEDAANVETGGSTEDQPLDHFGHNVALNPDGTLSVVNGVPAPDEDPEYPDAATWPPYIELRDVSSGDTIRRYYIGDELFGGDANTLPILPEWSPDGSRLAVALANSAPDSMCLWTYVTCNSPIAIMPVIDGQALGPPEIVATSADPEEYHYYPTWSPDGEWIVFQSARRVRDDSDFVTEPRSLGNANGVIRMVRSSGGPYVCPGPDCIELERGTQYSVTDAQSSKGRQSTWPKFTPFAQGEDDALTFVSFTSRIEYGFLASDRSQLWMFAVDTSRTGEDPSYAPIWLPYQDYADGSLTPYWTETLPCSVDPNGGCSGCVAGEECHVSALDRCECRAVTVK